MHRPFPICQPICKVFKSTSKHRSTPAARIPVRIQFLRCNLRADFPATLRNSGPFSRTPLLDPLERGADPDWPSSASPTRDPINRRHRQTSSQLHHFSSNSPSPDTPKHTSLLNHKNMFGPQITTPPNTSGHIRATIGHTQPPNRPSNILQWPHRPRIGQTRAEFDRCWPEFGRVRQNFGPRSTNCCSTSTDMCSGPPRNIGNHFPGIDLGGLNWPMSNVERRVGHLSPRVDLISAKTGRPQVRQDPRRFRRTPAQPV